MQRRLERRYVFGANEVRDMILAYLDTRDIQTPKDLSKCAFTMDAQNIVLAWDGEDEVRVL